jgi:hypothetical protein
MINLTFQRPTVDVVVIADLLIDLYNNGGQFWLSYFLTLRDFVLNSRPVHVSSHVYEVVIFNGCFFLEPYQPSVTNWWDSLP